tara:strand:+ start:423 stop:617 length:195 start_codon:yes stop_codon:yes gene_type:complete
MSETSGIIYSNCCFSDFNEDHGVCLECGEHAEGIYELEGGTFSDDEEDMDHAELWHHEGRDQDY